MQVTVMRGGLPESRHQVHVAVARTDGHLVAAAGDPDRPTTMRSAAKPLQAEPLVRSGVIDELGWDDGLLAVACGSHAGHDVHAEAVAHGFALAGLDPALLRNRTGSVDERLRHNCSGNHLAFLTQSSAESWPLESYRDEGHPSQRAAHDEVARAAGRHPGAVPVCVDGCGVLAFSLPLRDIAAVYARLPERYPRQATAMRTRPEMVAGDGELDTEVMRHVPGAVCKAGAEGLRAVALPGEGLGLALRVEDGNSRAVGPALVRVLVELLGDGVAASDGLAAFAQPALLNWSDEPVGELVCEGGLSTRAVV